MRFADKTRNIRSTDLKLLPSDAASFEPSQAPLSFKERLRARSAAPESTRKRCLAPPESTAAEGTAARDKSTEGTAAESDSDSDECPICLEVLDAATAVLLDCTHVFCAKCHEELSRRAAVSYHCPLCRKRAKLTEIV